MKVIHIVLFLMSSFLYATIINVPDDYSTIQGAIDASSDGDTVLVSAGTYVENIDYYGKNIVVQGENREATIIDGNQNGSVVTIASGEDSTAVLSDLTITNGGNVGFGGGIYLYGTSPVIKEIIVTNNSAQFGGGLYNEDNSNQDSSPQIKNSIFAYNSSYSGGGLRIKGSAPKINNILIHNNSAESMGAGMLVSSINDSEVSFINLTIVNNNAGVNGNAISLWDIGINYNLKFINSIIWNDNDGSDIYISGNEGYSPNGQIIFDYCDIENGSESFLVDWQGEVYVNNSIDLDPLFVSLENFDLYLTEESPCIDAGNPDLDGDGDDYTTDIDDQDPDGTRMDMGAYYYHQGITYTGPTWYVSTSGSDENDGSEESPFASIQHAIDASSDGDTVLVLSGTYQENINYNGKNIMLQGEDRSNTYIDGAGMGMVVTINNTTANSSLMNFTIQNGGNPEFQDGSGIYCDNCNTTLATLNIANNNPTHEGAGSAILADDANIIINEDTHVYNNSGTSGAIALRNSNVTIDDITIENFNSEFEGGAIYINNGSTVDVNNTTFRNNIASRGAGIFVDESDLTIQNSNLIGNISTGIGGGGISSRYSNLTVINTDFENNQAESGPGGGIFLDGLSEESQIVNIQNCTFNGNLSASDGAGINVASQGMLIDSCKFVSNVSNSNGGAIAGTGITSLVITNSSLANNQSADTGGGLYLNSGGMIMLSNVLIYGNSSIDGAGLSFYEFGADSIQINQTTIVQNNASNLGGGIYGVNSSIVMLNSIIWNNYPSQQGYFSSGGLWSGYSSIQNYDGVGIGMIDADPLFCNSDSSDFTLYDNSPCVGTGQDGANMGAYGIGCLSLLNNEEKLLIISTDGDGFGIAKEYDLQSNTYTDRATVGPGISNVWGASAFDMESDKFILIEPNGDNTASTWAYDHNSDSWQQMSNVDGISSEYWGSAVYDIESDLIILINVHGAGNLHYRFRTYDYNTDTWDNLNGLSFSDSDYIGSYWGTTSYDIRSDRVYLFSGHGSNGTIISSFVHEELLYETHTWNLDGAYWGDGSSSYDYESDRALFYNNNPGGSSQYFWGFNYETGLNNLGESPGFQTSNWNCASYSFNNDKVYFFNKGGRVNAYDYNSNTQELVFDTGESHGEFWGTMETINTPPPYLGPSWHVSTVGSDINDGSEDSPFRTIQAGINRAVDGDTILVDEGIYIESDLFVGYKEISIISSYGFENTTIQSDAGLIRIVNGDKTFLMDGFTMTGGSGNNIVHVENGSSTFKNMEFSNNGGLGNNDLFKGSGIGQTYFIDCIFKENIGENNVGVNSGTLIRCLFYDNQATNNPKPISECMAINCVVYNTEWYPGYGGSEDNEWTAGAMSGGTAINCIFWNNVGYAGEQQIYNAESVTYSNIQYGYEGNGNISEDPMFVGVMDGDFNIQSTSPCIDTGDPDLDGNGYDYNTDTDDQDPDGTRMDMGAYYYHQEAVYDGPNWYVSTSGSDDNDGNQGNPFATIQHGIDVSNDGDTVLVSVGTYVENINYSGKNIVVQGEERETTIIDGNQSGSVVSFINGEGPSAGLMNFTLTNGGITYYGGGVEIESSSPTLNEVIIENHSSSGIRISGSCSSVLNNLVIRNNTSDHGAGVYVTSDGTTDTSPVFTNVEITNNYGSISGAVHLRDWSNATFVNATIFGNTTASDNGTYGDVGGVIVWGSNDITTVATFINAIVYDNGPTNMENFATLNVSYSDVQGGWEGENNIDANPIFCNPYGGDFTLAQNSPCLGAGQDGSNIGSYGVGCETTNDESPTVTIGQLVESIGTSDTLVLNWTASDNNSLAMAQIFYSSNSLESTDFLSSIDAELGTYTFDIPDYEITSYSAFIIEVFDNAGNSSTDTSNFFSIYDNTPPVVQMLTPQEGFSIPEFSVFNVSFESSDNIEMLDHVFEYTADGEGFVIQFDHTPIDSFYFSVEGVTNTAQIRLTVTDQAGNSSTDISEQFSVTDNTRPTINLDSPVNGIIVGIGDQLEITWSDTDNVGVETVSLFYRTNIDWTSISENIQNDNAYSWIVPNESTESLQLRVIGQDAVGLADTSEVDGISIEISYPMVQIVSPKPGSIDFKTNEFHFNLSQPLDISTVTSENVLFTSMYSPDLQPTLTYVDTSTSIKVSFDNNIVSMDLISLTLSEQLTNVYGYSLDGDGDGEGGDSYTATFQTSMLSDYDGNDTISVEDLSQFIINWEDNNLTEELGPFVGEMPNVYVTPDGDYNYHDMGAFALMWNWYYSNNAMLFANYEDEGLPITVEAEHDSIYLDIPSDLSAYQVQIQYTPGSFFISSIDEKEKLFLTHQEQELGVYTIMAQPGQKKLVIPIEIRGRDANISISYKGITGQGELAGQMTKTLTIENIPDEFVLFPNYPNPFNPTTKIDFGLPQETNVQLVIFDILGREVITLVSGLQEPGYKSIIWNGTDAFGRNVSAGMYFYLLQAGDFRQVEKMILLK